MIRSSANFPPVIGMSVRLLLSNGRSLSGGSTGWKKLMKVVEQSTEEAAYNLVFNDGTMSSSDFWNKGHYEIKEDLVIKKKTRLQRIEEEMEK